MLDDISDAYLRGVIFGSGFVIFVQVAFVASVAALLFDPLRRSSTPSPNTRNPGNRDLFEGEKDSVVRETEHWPAAVVAFLEFALKTTAIAPPHAPFEWDQPGVEMSTTDPAPWLNILVHRFFLSLRESNLFKDKICAKMTDRMNSKLTMNSFVSHVRLYDMQFGDQVPKIHGVRILKGITEDLAVALELDITYQGGASVAIEPTLTAGIPLPVRVSISELQGKLRVRCPAIGFADMFSVSFLQDPNVSFKVDSSSVTYPGSEYLKGVVNTALSEIVRRIFLEMWILPAWRMFFLPLMIPAKVEDEMKRMDLVNTLSKAVKSTMATSAKNGSPLPDPIHPLLKKVSKRLPATSNIPNAVGGASMTPPITSTFSRNTTSKSFVTTGFKIYDPINVEHFPLNMTIDTETINLDLLEQSLIEPFQKLVQESAMKRTQPAMTGNGSLDCEWSVVKSRGDVSVLKGRWRLDGIAEAGSVFAGKFGIQCEAEKVFAILSHPEHLRHIENSYLGSTILKEFDDARLVRKSSFQVAKNTTKEYIVFEVQKKIVTDSGTEAYIVLSRSISSVKSIEDATPPQPLKAGISSAPVSRSTSPTRVPGPQSPEPSSSSSTSSSPVKLAASLVSEKIASTLASLPSTGPPIFPPARQSSLAGSISSNPQTIVYLQGYLIESVSKTSCSVTVLSQLSADLSKLETNFVTCRKMKAFVEDYMRLVEMQERSTESGAGKKKGIAEMVLAGGQEWKRYFVASAGELIRNRSKSPIRDGEGLDVAKGYPGETRKSGDLDDGSGSDYEDVQEEQVPLERENSLAVSISNIATTSVSSNAYPVANTVKKDSIMSSAVSIAKQAASIKRPSMGFLTRAAVVAAGGTIQSVQDPHAVTGYENSEAEEFPIGPLLPDSEALIEKKIIGKDTATIELPFNRDKHESCVEIAWEFIVAGGHSILFGINFRPDKPTSANEKTPEPIHLLFPESINDPRTRQIFPTSSITTSVVPSCRGSFSVSAFPSGTFILIWDNSNGVKKQEKAFTYRAAFRKFSMPTMINPVSAESLNNRYSCGVAGEVTITRKSLFRCFLTFDESMISRRSSANSQDNADTTTVLNWEYSTNGLELMFGVIYYPYGPVEGDFKNLQHEHDHDHEDMLHMVDMDDAGAESDASHLNASPVTAADLTEDIPSNSENPPPKPSRKTSAETPPLPPSIPNQSPLSMGFEKPSLAARLAAVTNDISTIQSQAPASNAPSQPHSRVGSESTANVLPRGNRLKSISIVSMTKVKSSAANMTGVIGGAGGTLVGSVPVDATGKGVYVIVWDNTASMVLPKVISFRVGLMTTLLK